MAHHSSLPTIPLLKWTRFLAPLNREVSLLYTLPRLIVIYVCTYVADPLTTHVYTEHDHISMCVHNTFAVCVGILHPLCICMYVCKTQPLYIRTYIRMYSPHICTYVHTYVQSTYTYVLMYVHTYVCTVLFCVQFGCDWNLGTYVYTYVFHNSHTNTYHVHTYVHMYFNILFILYYY